MITTRYYYDKLNKRDKQIYKAIYDGIMKYEQYVEVPDIVLTEQKVGWIYHCVLWDNPYIFSIGEYAMWHAVDEDKTKIKITTLYNPEFEKSCREKVECEVNKILAAPGLRTMTDFQKEVFVHDFVINNVEYDQTCGDGGKRIQPYTVYGALVEHKAVCEGIAKTVKLLLNLLDVKCIVVSGKYDGHGHAWNIVKIDDWSYNLDVTMDMGRVIHKGKMRYNYFNFRTADILNYVVDNAHMVPECVAIHNNYIVKAAGFVSNYERLKIYIEKGLLKRKSCLYFKVNRNVDDEFKKISFEQFQKEVDRAYCETARKLGISTRRFIDTTGPGEIVSVEIKYI
jgi:hypothetical protein